VVRERLSLHQLESLRSNGDRGLPSRAGHEHLFPDSADAYFRAERIDTAHGPVELAVGFAVLVVLEGSGELRRSAGRALAVQRGSTILIPHAAGETTLHGPMVAVCCRAPLISAGLADGLGTR
jgi:mannose-6-phosphate isomerase class I